MNVLVGEVCGHELSGFNKRILSPHSFEGLKSKVTVSIVLVLCEDLYQASLLVDGHLLSVSHCIITLLCMFLCPNFPCFMWTSITLTHPNGHTLN